MHECKVGIGFCTPIPIVRENGRLRKERITIEWHRARMGLSMPLNIRTMEIVADGEEIGEARNYAAEVCMKQTDVPEFLFFLDYDVIPSYDAVVKLMYRARCFPDYDIFAGVYCRKDKTGEPLIFKVDGQGSYWDWTVGDILRDIDSVHMGCTLIRTDLFEKLEHTKDNPWFKTVNEKAVINGALAVNRGTEDIYFCNRARKEVGAKILVDTSVLCGHQSIETGTIYGLPEDSLPIQRARWLAQHKEIEEPFKKAIDIGAGEIKRAWPGYKTYTLDIRPETGADYIQDVRQLNLPDEHFDLVASSHHLEHIGRWDQETVWKEMTRILKPGGIMEHVVPNAQWAGAHLRNGHIDTHVINVLYGAQEAHGYEREYNTHFFPYTPDIAKTLAEEMGLVDIEIITYKQQPDLKYNMIIKGRKPGGERQLSFDFESAEDTESAIDCTEEVEVEA